MVKPKRGRRKDEFWKRVWSSPGVLAASSFAALTIAQAISVVTGYASSIVTFSDFGALPEGEAQWIGSFISAVLYVAFALIAPRAFRLHIKKGWSPVYAIFIFSAMYPPALLYDLEATIAVTSLSMSQLVAIAISASIAQITFAILAWRIRTLPSKKVMAGVHSGLTFAALNVGAYIALAALAISGEPVRDAVNGELWALVGAAQLIVAVTAGVNEARAARFEALIERKFGTRWTEEL